MLEFEIELSRKEVIAAAERKLLRPLSANERAGIGRIDSLLRLESFCRALNSPAYTAAEVLKDLERIAK
jgi:hypothetical protein